MGVIANSIASVQAGNVLGSAAVAQVNSKNKDEEQVETNTDSKNPQQRTTGTKSSSIDARMATAKATQTKFATSPYPPPSNSNNNMPTMPMGGGAGAGMAGAGKSATDALAAMKNARNRGGGSGGGCGGGPGRGGGGGSGGGFGGGRGVDGPNTNNNQGWGNFNAVDLNKPISNYGINVNQIKNIAETENKGVPVREVNSEADLQKIMQNGLPTIIKRGATWCGPCRELDKNLPNIYKDLKGKVNIATIDVDKNPELAKQFFKGDGIPETVILDTKGKKVGDSIVGNEPNAITQLGQLAIQQNEKELQQQIEINKTKQDAEGVKNKASTSNNNKQESPKEFKAHPLIEKTNPDSQLSSHPGPPPVIPPPEPKVEEEKPSPPELHKLQEEPNN